jgi:hypothetical protein
MPSSIDIRVEESFQRAFIVAALRLVFVLMAGRAECAEAQDAGNQNQQEFFPRTICPPSRQVLFGNVMPEE